MSKRKKENDDNGLISWTPIAWEQYESWLKEDKKTVDKINTLIKDCLRNPLSGIGKPEKLCGNLSGFISRRITQEHRLVYRLGDGGKGIVIIMCKYHYE